MMRKRASKYQKNLAIRKISRKGRIFPVYFALFLAFSCASRASVVLQGRPNKQTHASSQQDCCTSYAKNGASLRPVFDEHGGENVVVFQSTAYKPCLALKYLPKRLSFFVVFVVVGICASWAFLAILPEQQMLDKTT